MINLAFFPSRQLAFYMVRLFLTRSLAVLFALVLVLMTLDLLGEAGKILAVPGNGDAALWHYVALRIPLLVSRFLPFSVLLGTLIAFVGLNQNSEVVAMKAAGLSAHQILAPLILASIGIAAALFAFNEGVVVKCDARGQRLGEQRLQADPAGQRHAQQRLGAQWRRPRPRRDRHRPRRADDGSTGSPSTTAPAASCSASSMPTARDSAAAPATGCSRTSRVYDADMNVVRRLPAMAALAGVTPDQFTLAKVDPDRARLLDAEAAHRRARSRRPTRPTKPAPASRTRSRGRSRSC